MPSPPPAANPPAAPSSAQGLPILPPVSDAGRHALPLAELLRHTAGAVQAVRNGRSLTAALALCPAVARPGTQALAFTVLRRLGSALAVRAALAPRRPPPSVDTLLLCAIALLWTRGSDAQPAAYAEHTVVDQAVRAAQHADARSAPFVNAVLRRFLRERTALRERLLRDDIVARTNHPAWWVERLRSDWPLHWSALLAGDDQPPPMVLRVNQRRGTVEAYLSRLAHAGLGAQAAVGGAVRLDRPCPVERLPGFADGDVSVQDVAAQQAAPRLLDAVDGLLPALPANAHVLDACAAPGGKTAHLLELAPGLDVLALDRDADRLQRVAATLQRIGARARLAAADAAEPSTWWDGRPFDAILLDAPCSASGIVRRHPDVRWLRRASDIAALAAQQSRLLDALWPLLAPGGRLLYCTCSVFRDEGEHQIDAFLQRTPGAQPADASTIRGHLLPVADNGIGPSGPPSASADHDAFYYALLIRPA